MLSIVKKYHLLSHYSARFKFCCLTYNKVLVFYNILYTEISIFREFLPGIKHMTAYHLEVPISLTLINQV